MTLTDYCLQQRLCPIKAMDLLQDYGLVSDCAVTTDDVAPSEHDVAIRFAKLNRQDLNATTPKESDPQ